LKTNQPKYTYQAFKFVVFIALLFVSQSIVSQVRPNDTTYNKGQMVLGNPKSIVEAYTYDPATDRYILNKSFAGIDINYPIILTPKEY